MHSSAKKAEKTRHMDDRTQQVRSVVRSRLHGYLLEGVICPTAGFLCTDIQPAGAVAKRLRRYSDPVEQIHE